MDNVDCYHSICNPCAVCYLYVNDVYRIWSTSHTLVLAVWN